MKSQENATGYSRKSILSLIQDFVRRGHHTADNLKSHVDEAIVSPPESNENRFIKAHSSLNQAELHMHDPMSASQSVEAMKSLGIAEKEYAAAKHDTKSTQ